MFIYVQMISSLCFPTTIFVETLSTNIFASIFYFSEKMTLLFHLCYCFRWRWWHINSYILFFDYTKIKFGPPLHGHSPSTISIRVHFPWHLGLKTFLNLVLFPSAPCPPHLPPRWVLWALLLHILHTILPRIQKLNPLGWHFGF